MPRSLAHHIVYSPPREVVLARAGREQLPRRPWFEAFIVKSGSCEFEREQAGFPLAPGDLFVADPGIVHSIRTRGRGRLLLLALNFNLSRGGDAGDAMDWPTLPAFLQRHATHCPAQAHLLPLFEHAAALARRDAAYLENSFYHDSTRLLLRQVIAALVDGTENAGADYPDYIHSNRIVAAIERRLPHGPVRIADLARDCGLSERTLRRHWQRLGTRPLTEEINERRIRQACQWLLLPDIGIAEVGDRVGIPSAARFSRLFREHRGTTPSDWRRRHLGAMPGFMPG